MKFRYAGLLAASLIAAILILLLTLTLGIAPITLARSQNSEITQYLTEARDILSEAKSNPQSVVIPDLIRTIDEYLSSTQIVASDQKKILEQIAQEDSSIDVGSVSTSLASLIAIVGTLSSIILSWRKDVREAKAELEKLKSQTPKIEIP